MLSDKKNKKFTNIVVLSLLVLVVIFLLAIFKLNNKDNDYSDGLVFIAGQELKVKLAKTSDQKSIGLGNTKVLASDAGMLFVYNNYVIPSFWMKDMDFPIDIIWIKDDLVVGFEKDLKPQSSNINLPIYQPKTFINYVLEVNSGFVDKYSLKIGDKVKLAI